MRGMSSRDLAPSFLVRFRSSGRLTCFEDGFLRQDGRSSFLMSIATIRLGWSGRQEV